MKHKSVMIALIGLATFGVPAFGAEPAGPGTVNYVEGAAYLDLQPLSAKDVGSATLIAGQELRTRIGKLKFSSPPACFCVWTPIARSR